jgi:hypothetical protein
MCRDVLGIIKHNLLPSWLQHNRCLLLLLGLPGGVQLLSWLPSCSLAACTLLLRLLLQYSGRTPLLLLLLLLPCWWPLLCPALVLPLCVLLLALLVRCRCCCRLLLLLLWCLDSHCLAIITKHNLLGSPCSHYNRLLCLAGRP